VDDRHIQSDEFVGHVFLYVQQDKSCAIEVFDEELRTCAFWETEDRALALEVFRHPFAYVWTNPYSNTIVPRIAEYA